MANPQFYIIPTPIGNMGDITLRALEILKSVDIIYAEDTRVSGQLLKHFAIQKPIKSYHNHNEHQVVFEIIEILQNGKSVGLISDAGTPGISDPGFLVVREILKNNLSVSCLPGPSALIPALVQSGFPTDRFVFEGFLPVKKGRKKRLAEIAMEKRTVVLYESPYRILKLLQEINDCMPDRKISITREISKIFEQTIRGNAKEIILHFEKHPPKGEFVVTLAPFSDESE